MARKLSRLIAILASVLLLTAFGSGCQGGGETSGGGEAQDKPFGKYEEPVKLTYFAVDWGKASYAQGETPTDNLWTRFYKEYLNIELEAVNTFSENDLYTQVQLAAAVDDLPDFFWTYGMDQIKALQATGALLPVDDIIRDYASERFHQVIGYDDGLLYNLIKIENQTMGIPLPVDMLDSLPVVFIRADWMENLGLKEPKSLDDILNIAHAFVYNDPDGNGKNDTLGIPMEGPGGFAGATWKMFFNAHGAFFDQWVVKDNQLAWGAVQPEARQALQAMVDARKDGLFPEEFGELATLEEKLNNGLYGILPGAFHNPTNYLSGNYSAYGADWNVYAIPAAQIEVSYPADRFALITEGCKNPEAVIKMMNARLEVRPDGRYADWYAEVYTDEKYDGTSNFGLALPRHFEDPLTNYNRGLHVQEALEKGNGGDLDGDELSIYESIQDDPDSLEGWANRIMYTRVMPVVGTILDKLHYDAYYGPPTPTESSKGAQLSLFQQNAFLKIIDGKDDISTFDLFIEDWMSKGGEKWTQEVNEWYAALGQ